MPNENDEKYGIASSISGVTLGCIDLSGPIKTFDTIAGCITCRGLTGIDLFAPIRSCLSCTPCFSGLCCVPPFGLHGLTESERETIVKNVGTIANSVVNNIPTYCCGTKVVADSINTLSDSLKTLVGVVDTVRKMTSD